VPEDTIEKARAEVKRARVAGLTLREIGEAAGLHLTRVREVVDLRFR
jgi:hypothetical protein